MAEMEWLKTTFTAGYDSGEILDRVPSSDPLEAGGHDRRILPDGVFESGFPVSTPGFGRSGIGSGQGLLVEGDSRVRPQGNLTTVDFVDVTGWLRPGDYAGRLTCHKDRRSFPIRSARRAIRFLLVIRRPVPPHHRADRNRFDGA